MPKGNPMYCRIGSAVRLRSAEVISIWLRSPATRASTRLISAAAADVLADQVTRLGYDVGCYEQIVCAGFQQSRTSSMVSIVAV